MSKKIEKELEQAIILMNAKEKDNYLFRNAYALMKNGKNEAAINAFEKSTGQKLNYTIGPRRSGDIEQIFGDATKSSKVLGWTAELNVEDMMKSAWEWEKYIAKNPF
jgi:UDP-glucose 4-epimerase